MFPNKLTACLSRRVLEGDRLPSLSQQNNLSRTLSHSPVATDEHVAQSQETPDPLVLAD